MGPASSLRWDIVVIGSGVAGLTAVLRLARDGATVGLLSKGNLEASSSRTAQGGIAVTLSPEDSPADHAADTLAAAAGLGNPDAARIEELIRAGLTAVFAHSRLESRGAHFRCDAPESSSFWNFRQVLTRLRMDRLPP